MTARSEQSSKQLSEQRGQLRKQLRKQLRTQRRALSIQESTARNQRICVNLHRFLPFLRARRIGAYWPTDGEVNLISLFDDRFYLPILREQSRRWQSKGLLFGSCDEHLKLNTYGIPEPDARLPISARTLDLLLVPLVGFSREGHRLGMGGGYYDRTFKELGAWKKVFKLGVGYEFQQTEFPVEHWDQPLDGVVTERELLVFS